MILVVYIALGVLLGLLAFKLVMILLNRKDGGGGKQ